MKPLSNLFAFLFVCGILLCGGCSSRTDTTSVDEAALQNDSEFKLFQLACIDQKYSEAYKFAQTLTQRYPKNGTAWVGLGFVCERIQKISEAFEAYEKATQANPSNANAWFNLGSAYGNLGSLDDEIKCYQKAIRLRPNYAKAYLNLGLAYEEKGDRTEATKAFQRAISIDPSIMQPPAPPSEENTPQENPPNESKSSNPLPNEVLQDKAPVDIKTTESSKTSEKSSLLELPLDLTQKTETSTADVITPSSAPKSKETTSPIDPQRKAKELNNLGVRLEQEQKWMDAIQSYRDALKQLPNDPIIWNNLGMAQVGRTRLAESVSSFEKALQLSPNDPTLKQNLGLVHMAMAGDLIKQNEMAQTISHLKSASQLLPEWEEPKLYLGHAFFLNNQLDEAKSTYQELTSQKPLYYPGWLALAKIFMRSGENEKAIEAFSKAIGIRADDPSAWYLYGIAHLSLKHYSEAAVAFDGCIKRDPLHGDAWENRGVCYAHLNRLSDSIFSLEKAVGLKANSSTTRKKLADAYILSGRGDQAVGICHELLKEKPADPLPIWKSLAFAYEVKKDWEEANRSWKKAADLQKKDGESWAGLAQTLTELGDRKEAYLAYDRAVYYGYKTPEVWNNLGVTLGMLGDYEKALSAFAEAARILKNDPDILVNIGIIFHRQKPYSSMTLNGFQMFL